MNKVKIYLKNISTKISYEYLTNRKVIIKTTAMEHLSQTYNISSEEWKQSFILPIHCTCERKLHDFQDKLLHYCLTLNPYLFKIGIQTSELCDLCHQEKETLQKLFFILDLQIYFGNKFLHCSILGIRLKFHYVNVLLFVDLFLTIQIINYWISWLFWVKYVFIQIGLDKN